MSKVKIQGNASGTGVLTVTAPNTSTDRTITLPDGDVTLGAATPSIDDNGNATAITIDSDENVLIGKTTYVGGSGVTGIDIRPAGMVNIAREGDTLMYMNRKTSDGDIVEFRKDGTTKGSIGVNSSGAYITLGGTGAANTLDDYEEGTFTATTTFSSDSISSSNCIYTKVGRMVQCSMYFNATINTVNINIGGLPFSALKGTTWSVGIGGNRYLEHFGRFDANGTNLVGTLSGTTSSNTEFYVSVTYQTA